MVHAIYTAGGVNPPYAIYRILHAAYEILHCDGMHAADGVNLEDGTESPGFRPSAVSAPQINR